MRGWGAWGLVTTGQRRSAGDWRQMCACASTVALALSILATFLISILVMDYIGLTHYESSGGSFLEKVHPGTWLAILALLLHQAASPEPGRSLSRQIGRYPGLLLYGLSITAAFLYAVLVSKNPVTPFFDTFLLPALYFLLLESLDRRSARILGTILFAILAANALVGVIEFVVGVRFETPPLPDNVTDDPRHGGEAVFDWRAALATDWRASAFLGHPLSNAGVTAIAIAALCLNGASWLSPFLRIGVLGLQVLAMFAFGGRASLVASFLVLGVASLGHFLGFLHGRQRVPLRSLGYGMLAAPLLIVGVGALIEGGFFERAIERFANDSGSAQTRTAMFELFRPLTMESLLVGPDPAVVATNQRIEGLEFGIESFLVAFALQYGLLVAAMMLAGLGALCWSICQVAGRRAIAPLLVFFVTASTAVSISTKTTMFGMVVAIILLFMRRPETADQNRPGPGL